MRRRRQQRRRRLRKASGNTLTIYSWLPLQGDSRPQSEDVVNGKQLALEKAGGKAGKFTIKYMSLDDATAATGKWEPGKVSENARKAVGDDNTIAYLGEFNSGRVRDLDPDHQRGRHPAGLAVEHVRGPDPLRGRGEGRAGEVLAVRHARRSGASCPPTTSRRRRRSPT